MRSIFKIVAALLLSSYAVARPPNECLPTFASFGADAQQNAELAETTYDKLLDRLGGGMSRKTLKQLIEGDPLTLPSTAEPELQALGKSLAEFESLLQKAEVDLPALRSRFTARLIAREQAMDKQEKAAMLAQRMTAPDFDIPSLAIRDGYLQPPIFSRLVMRRLHPHGQEKYIIYDPASSNVTTSSLSNGTTTHKAIGSSFLVSKEGDFFISWPDGRLEVRAIENGKIATDPIVYPKVPVVNPRPGPWGALKAFLFDKPTLIPKAIDDLKVTALKPGHLPDTVVTESETKAPYRHYGYVELTTGQYVPWDASAVQAKGDVLNWGTVPGTPDLYFHVRGHTLPDRFVHRVLIARPNAEGRLQIVKTVHTWPDPPYTGAERHWTVQYVAEGAHAALVVRERSNRFTKFFTDDRAIPDNVMAPVNENGERIETIRFSPDGETAIMLIANRETYYLRHLSLKTQELSAKLELPAGDDYELSADGLRLYAYSDQRFRSLNLLRIERRHGGNP